MPTELTPATFRYSQQYPISLEHPLAFAKMFGNGNSSGSRGGMNMGLHQYQHSPQSRLYAQQYPQYPQSGSVHSHSHGLNPAPFLGPPSLLQPPPMLIPGNTDGQPGKVLPNGTRNPWAAYAGESYIPGSEKASRMSLDQTGSPLLPASSLRSHHTPGTALSSILIPIPRSVVTSNGWVGAGSAGSAGSVRSQMGQMRIDEGWDGSSGRSHLGHLPDPTSTAGRLGRTPEAIGMGLGFGQGMGGWRMGPSSWQDHQRFTPGFSPSNLPTVAYLAVPDQSRGSGLSRSGHYQQEEYPNGQNIKGSEREPAGEDKRRPRRASVAIPPKQECSSCCSWCGRRGGALVLSESGRKPWNGDKAEILSTQQSHPPVVSINDRLGRIV